jgi:hypothetical protein
MIKKRIEILLISVISLIFSYYLVNYFVVELEVYQYLLIEVVIGLLSYLQDYHKENLLKPK